jgi:hypothetical protein
MVGLLPPPGSMRVAKKRLHLTKVSLHFVYLADLGEAEKLGCRMEYQRCRKTYHGVEGS